MTITSGDAVVFEYTGRLEDGSVFDTSRESVANESELAAAQGDREYSPLTVEVGAGELIEGLEDALVGMDEGTETTVTVPPEEAYGEWTEERVQEYGTEELREALGGEPPEEGIVLEAQGGARGEIVHVDDDLARIDFNSPLAGETLEFDIEIVDVTSPSSESEA